MHYSRSSYIIDEYGGSSRGLKVWFRRVGYEIDPDIIELQEEIKRIQDAIRTLQEDDIENSEWKEHYERWEKFNESLAGS